MRAVSNLQNLEHIKFDECEQANLIYCEFLKENLKIFGPKLKALTLRRTESVDNLVCDYLAYISPFKNLKVLDLSYNQIETPGFWVLICSTSTFAASLQSLNLERNIILTSLPEIISRLQLLRLVTLNLNLNQIEWSEDWVRRQGYKVMA